MATTVSQPVRIAAALGLAAALALAGAFMLLGRKGATASGPVVPKHRIPHVHRAAAPSASQATPAAQAPAKPGAQAVQAAKAPGRPAAELAALRAGLPPRLARALGQHAVVVVALTDPQSEVDGISFAEAQAGAQLAGVGFVPLNVLSQADIGKLTEQIGAVLPDPGVLVFTRPATLAARIDGFADKDTVAQAAMNAARGL